MAQDELLQIANRYELHEELGRGGMGAVYRATDRLTGTTVALKRVTELGDAGSEDSQHDTLGFRLALAHEFKTLSSLRHPHIISVLDYGFDKNHFPFFTMEYLPRPRSILQAGHNQSHQRQIDLLVHLLQALAYLHRRGILHRDLKPANVLVTEGDILKVLDFGLAARPEELEEGSDEIAGTLSYMAPEIFRGYPFSKASDLYAVGVIAYEIFTGRHPFQEAQNRPDLLIQAVITSEPSLLPVEAWELAYETGQSATSPLPAKAGFAEMVEHDDPTQVDVTAQLSQVIDDPTTFLDNLSRLDQARDPDSTGVLPVTLSEEHDERSPGLYDKTEVDPESVITSMWHDYQPQTTTLTDVEGRRTVVQAVAQLLEKSPERRYHDAYQVIHDLVTALGQGFPQESRAIRESFLQAATFVGRQQEMSQLATALDAILDTENSHGSFWLVSGESGVGKTRLLDELRSRALVQGVLVLHGQAVEAVGGPYQLWREPLRRLLLGVPIDDVDASILSDIVPDIAQLLRREIPPVPEVQDTDYKQRLVGTITSLFQRQTEPILLLMEDLQWSVSSIEVLKVLKDMVNRLPLLIVGSYRNDERPDLPDEFPGAAVLKLDRLTDEQIQELTVSMLGESGELPEVQQLLKRETEGNVFFLVEVVRALAEEAGRLADVGRTTLPETVAAGGIEQIVNRRLNRVPFDDRVLLQLAAVTGREVDLSVLKTIMDRQIHPGLLPMDVDAWLTTCANIGVLEVHDGVWRFSHDKLRQGALASIDEKERPNFHRSVALGIEATYPEAREHYQALVRHWQAAGDAPKEHHYCQLAGTLSLLTGAFLKAITFFDRALELLDELSLLNQDRRRIEAELRIKLGEALENQGDYARAAENLEIGLAMSREVGDLLAVGQALSILGDVAWRQSDYARSIELCQQSYDIFKELGAQRGMAQAFNRIGIVYYEQGEYDSATRYLEESLQLAHASDFLPVLVSVTNNLGLIAFAQGNYDLAHGYFGETLAMAQRSGERRKIAIARLNLGVIAGEQRDYPVATDHFQETLRICREIGERRGVSLALKNLGGLAEYQNNLDEAEACYQQSLDMYRELGERQSIAATLAKLGHVARLKGDTEWARSVYLDALRLADEIDATPTVVEVLSGLAGVIDDPVQGLKWLGLALHHPAMFDNIHSDAMPILEQLRSSIPEDEAEAAIEHGKSLDLKQVVALILTDMPPI